MEKMIDNICKERGYTIDYLSDGSPIFASKNLYSFTSDSTALAKMVKEKDIETLVDLCSGGGIVGLEVIGSQNVNNLVMVEIQTPLATMAEFSSKLSKTKTDIKVLNINLKDSLNFLKEGSVDVITCNPPYFKKGSGEAPKDTSRALARHELLVTLEDIISLANKLLKKSGKLYMVHIESRMAEITKLLNHNNFTLEDKIVLGGKLKRVLIEAKKV